MRVKNREVYKLIARELPPCPSQSNAAAGGLQPVHHRPALQEAVRREGGCRRRSRTDDTPEPHSARRRASSTPASPTAIPPVLHTFNVQGERIDSIEFHPSWHALMQGIAARGYHTGPWALVDGRAIPGAHVARAAGYLMQAQVECGTLCPTTMTYGAIAAMRRDPWLAREWVPQLLTREYDPRDIPIAHKRGGLIGMGMTEKQGGSDVRANTYARARASADGSYRITGHKWFFSAPQCDAHLVLAQTEARPVVLFRAAPAARRHAATASISSD